MLQTLLAYVRGVGVDARWVVIEGDPRFFEITKRLHNHLYGTPGDGGPLGAAERQDYEETLRAQRRGTRRRSCVPTTSSCCTTRRPAGLAASVQRTGAACRLALPRRRRFANEHSEQGWEFLRPYVDAVNGYVFSCEQFAPGWVPRKTSLSLRHRSIRSRPRTSRSTARRRSGYSSTSGCSAADGASRSAMFTRRDGSQGRITRHVDLLGRGRRRRRGTGRGAGVALGRAQGHGGVLTGSPSTSSTAPTPISSWPGRRRAVSPTTPRRIRCSTSASSSGKGSRSKPDAVRTSCASRWTTPTKTPPSSMRCNATRPSSCRRASPRASGSRSPRRCGSHGRSSPPRSAASSIRSCPARAACSSTTPATSRSTVDRGSLLEDDRERERMGTNGHRRDGAIPR